VNDALARARLERMVAADEEPTLTPTEIDDLLALARRADTAGTAPHVPWKATTAYGVGDITVPDPRNAHVYVAAAAGTSGAVAPTWPTVIDATVVDGTVTWQEAGADLWVPTYDLRRAAAEGWRQKAGKQAAVTDIAVDGQSVYRAQIVAHCLRMADEYSARGARSVPITSSTSRDIL
jgi:hypothetical protein